VYLQIYVERGWVSWTFRGGLVDGVRTLKAEAAGLSCLTVLHVRVPRRDDDAVSYSSLMSDATNMSNSCEED
jgi:hypothetical protein